MIPNLPQAIASNEGMDFNNFSDKLIMNIAGSNLSVTFGEEQLPKAFACLDLRGTL